MRSGLDERQSAVQQAEAIIDAQVGNFLHWMESRDMVPLIRGLRDQGENARRGELDRAMRMLARGDDPKAVLEALSHGLTNKLLHAPTRALHEAAGDDRTDLASAVDRLYKIRQRP